jgi:hypothetical protein
MGCAVSERRAHERAEDPWSSTAKATLRPGRSISIVNISRGGALVEGTHAMRPGARVLVQIVTSTRSFGLSAIVLRCGVLALNRDGGVVYQAALRFDERRDWTGEVDVAVA